MEKIKVSLQNITHEDEKRINDARFMKNGVMDDNNYRYALGVNGKNPLIFFGINPSTATPENYDQTMKRAKYFALKNNYDSWIMFNIYPQRATNPNNLANECDENIHKENIKIINKLIPSNSTIVAAWGNLITKRAYLINCLIDIVKALKNKEIKWKRISCLTKKGNPKHLLYLSNDEKMFDFNIEEYKNNLSRMGIKINKEQKK